MNHLKYFYDLFFFVFFVRTDYQCFTDTVYIKVSSHPKEEKTKSTTKYESSMQAKQKGHTLCLIILNCGAKPVF